MPEAATEQPRQAANLVTSETLADFNRQKLGLPRVVQDVKPSAEAPAATPEAKKPESAQDKPKGDSDKPDKIDADQAAAEEHHEKRKNSFSERLSELAGARKEAERREAEAKAEAARLKSELEALQKQAKPDAEPDPKNFTDAVEYAKALSKWEVSKALRERDEKEQTQRQEAEKARFEREWRAKVKKTTADLDDFAEVVSGQGPQAPMEFLQILHPLIVDSDVGPRIMYHLNKHPEELEEMVEMPRSKMLRHFAKLEERLEGELNGKKPAPKAEEPPAKPARKPVEAPEPITPVSGAGTAAHIGIVDDKGNVTADYSAYKRERKAGRIP